jgi:hypothetical protein
LLVPMQEGPAILRAFERCTKTPAPRIRPHFHGN